MSEKSSLIHSFDEKGNKIDVSYINYNSTID